MANYRQIGAAIAVLLFAVFLFVMSFFVQSSTVTTIGPEFMPRVISVVMFLLGLMNLKGALRDYSFLKAQGKLIPPTPKEDRPSFLQACLNNLDWISGGLMLIYVLCISKWGFWLPSMVYMFLQILLYTTNKKRNFILYVVLSLVIPSLIYFGFRNYFHLMLPTGPLG